MPLSLNEIKSRAAQFALDYQDAVREEAESQSFLNDFFNIFGISRRKVAAFEAKVKLPESEDGETGYIDLFWKGKILIEMKSRGKDLVKAEKQARKYVLSLPENQLPQVVLVSDFERFHYYDYENGRKLTAFTLNELADHIDLFTFMAGYEKRIYREQDPVNLEAAELMGKIHDLLKECNYSGHPLEVYLVRLLFCMFADDTSIFGHDDLLYYLRDRTAPDGSDLAAKLAEFFAILNTPPEQRLLNLDEQLAEFPYVNGDLFKEPLPFAAFNSEMRDILIRCAQLDWGKISPAIFGAMFQAVIDPIARRNLGAHYTSEKNILKLIHPLFLDALWDEFRRIQRKKSGKRQALDEFHAKLARLKFLDPACGCGNFLVITYREIRLLEIEVLKEKFRGDRQRVLDIDQYCLVNVNQFYGIEIEEFPAQVAKVALWMMDHQMNLKVRDAFGQYFVRIPFKTSPAILCANALPMDWETLVPKEELSYILGNPPFGGARLMSAEQKRDLEGVFGNLRGRGNLDYVTCWYRKAAEYIQGTKIECAFVSTNSITQGEQPDILWRHLKEDYGVVINFAHQTFKWTNEARRNAAVYCVIVGFGPNERPRKQLFIYPEVTAEPVETEAAQINAYLVDAPNVFIKSRSVPLCGVPKMGVGNQPIDNGNFLFTQEEMEDFIRDEPVSQEWFRPWFGSVEFINNSPRYVLFLKDCSPDQLRQMPKCKARVEAVAQFRLASKRQVTRELAKTPKYFAFENISTAPYLLIPRVSSENRRYIPIGLMDPYALASDAALIVPNATLYHFGILTSRIHMAWTRYICGRLKSDYRYSSTIVYNNFPWPEISETQRALIEDASQKILDTRAQYPESSLADLYDPDAMPKPLFKAHEKLDRLVDKIYASQKAFGKKRGGTFDSDADRIAWLFELYQELTRKE